MCVCVRVGLCVRGFVCVFVAETFLSASLYQTDSPQEDLLMEDI